MTPATRATNEKSFEQDIALNLAAFIAKRDEIRRQYSGRYVVLAEGKLLATGSTYDEALTEFQRLPSIPACYFIFEAESEPIFDVFTDFRTRS